MLEPTSRRLARNPGGLAAGALWTIGSLLFPPGVLGAMKLMRGRGITLGQIGAGLMSIGLILFAANVA